MNIAERVTICKGNLLQAREYRIARAEELIIAMEDELAAMEEYRRALLELAEAYGRNP